MRYKPSGYTYTENDIIKDTNISFGGKILYIYMLSKSTDGNAYANISYSSVYSDLGMTKQSTCEIIKSLDDRGYIKIKHGNLTNSNRYYFRKGTERDIKADLSVVTNQSLTDSAKLIYIILDNSKFPLSKEQLMDNTAMSLSTFKRSISMLIDKNLIYCDKSGLKNYYFTKSKNKIFPYLRTVGELPNDSSNYSKISDFYLHKKGFKNTKIFYEKIRSFIGEKYFSNEISCVAVSAKKICNAIADDFLFPKRKDKSLFDIYCLNDNIDFSSLILGFINDKESPNCKAFLHKSAQNLDNYYKGKRISQKYLSNTINWSFDNDVIMIYAYIKDESQTQYICKNCYNQNEQFYCFKNGFDNIKKGFSYKLLLRVSLNKKKYEYTIIKATKTKATIKFQTNKKLADKESIVFVKESKLHPKKRTININAVSLINCNELTIPFKSVVILNNIPKNYPILKTGIVLSVMGNNYTSLKNGIVTVSNSFYYITDNSERIYSFLTQIIGMPDEVAKNISTHTELFSAPANIAYTKIEQLLSSLLTDNSAQKHFIDRIKMVFGSPELSNLISSNLNISTETDVSPKKNNSIKMQNELINSVYKKFGIDSLYIIKNNPYRLFNDFDHELLLCDKIANNLDFSYNSDIRIKSISERIVRQECKNGNIGISIQELKKQVDEMIEANNQVYKPAIELSELIEAIKKSDKLIIYNDYILSKRAVKDENIIAREIVRINSAVKPSIAVTQSLIDSVCDELGKKLNDDKIKAICLLEQGGVSIINGGAGTGKSLVINAILKTYLKLRPNAAIKLCAPTGKAAENINKNDYIKPTTIHSLLGIKKETEDDHIKSNPQKFIDAELIIVDEASMINEELAAVFFSAIKGTTRLILVGDQNQLPPVGTGQVFKDLLESNFCNTVSLKSVYRQKNSSSVYINSMKVLDGKTDFITDEHFKIFKFNNDKEMEEAIIQKAVEIKEHDKSNNPLLMQVIIPINKHFAGVNKTNITLQSCLNPSSEEIIYGNNLKFKKGDRVVFTENRKQYNNGQTGTIIRIDKQSMCLTVELDNGKKTIDIPRPRFNNLSLAYAMTIHKSQGSQFNTVIVSLPKASSHMMTRNLLYTAITRAEENVFIYTVEGNIEAAVNQTSDRFTLLQDKIKEQQFGNGECDANEL